MEEATAKQEVGRRGIGLFGLIGMVVSSCIGSGAFAITGQLSQVASPGAALIAWLIVGVGFLALALSLNNLGARRPDLPGIFSYAQEGFGPFAGFISGWGYWLSAWLGNVAFATMMMSTLGYFFPAFLPGNTVPCIAIASVVMWLLTYFVIRGVESASVLNAVVMVCKVASLAVFIIFSVFMFNAGVFTADFWGTVYNNAVAAGSAGADAVALGDVPQQIINCLIIMMWVFVGVEGASVMSSRAARKSDVGKATVIGLACLLAIYIGCSVLPYARLPCNALCLRGHGAGLGWRVHLDCHHHLDPWLLAFLHDASGRDDVRDGGGEAAPRFVGCPEQEGRSADEPCCGGRLHPGVYAAVAAFGRCLRLRLFHVHGLDRHHLGTRGDVSGQAFWRTS